MRAQTPPRRSRSRPLGFALISLATTTIDVGLLLLLALRFDVPVLIADPVAIAVASVVSFRAHRASMVQSNPFFRWVRDPLGFVLLAATAGALDTLVVVVVLGSTDPEPLTLVALVGAKVVGLAVAIAYRVLGYRYVLHPLVVEARQRRDVPLTDGSVRFSVVVPAFEAAGVIGTTVGRIKAELADVAAAGGLEVIVVDDGSSDATADVALAAGAEQVLSLPVNLGKGAAVRAGMVASRGRSVCFTDADLAYDPTHLRRILEAVEDGWDVAIGNRRHPDSEVTRHNGLRALGSLVVNRLSAVVLLAAPRDTQCGLKGFRGDVARELFARTRVDGFAFDIEVLHLVERAAWSLVEIPVRLDETDGSSTVHLTADVLTLGRDLARVRRWAATGAYDAIAEADRNDAGRPDARRPDAGGS